MCQGTPACEFDFLMTGRREFAIETLETERKFEGLKEKGEVICKDPRTIT